MSDPGRGLRVSARAPDGLIEAIEADPGGAPQPPFLIGVQWHPEDLHPTHRAAQSDASFPKSAMGSLLRGRRQWAVGSRWWGRDGE